MVIFCYVFSQRKTCFFNFLASFFVYIFFYISYKHTYYICFVFAFFLLLYISISFAICLVLTMSYFEPSICYMYTQEYILCSCLLNFIKSVYSILYLLVFKSCRHQFGTFNCSFSRTFNYFTYSKNKKNDQSVLFRIL